MTRVAVLGTGLIGGSIGLAARARAVADEIRGFDIDDRALDTALRAGAITHPAPAPEDAVADADLVFLAMPVDRIAETAQALAASLGPAAVVTDVGSTKSLVVAEAETSFGDRFVGGHPIDRKSVV